MNKVRVVQMLHKHTKMARVLNRLKNGSEWQEEAVESVGTTVQLAWLLRDPPCPEISTHMHTLPSTRN